MSDEALHFEDLSTAEYLGDLSVYPPDEYRQKFLVIGDLRAPFGGALADTFDSDEHGDWGNYIAERIIREAMPEDLAARVELDPEGSTFFAYAEDIWTARIFIKFVRELAVKRGTVLVPREQEVA